MLTVSPLKRGTTTGLNSKFSFSETGYYVKVKELSRSNLFLIA